jgi:hypothetical protein
MVAGEAGGEQMSLVSAGTLGVYRDLTAKSQRVVVNVSVVQATAVRPRRGGTATGLALGPGGRGAAAIPGSGPESTDPAPRAATVATPPDSSAPAGAATPSGDQEVDGGTVAHFAQLLIAQIPSEALLAYIALLALFSAAGEGYVTGRWVLYGFSLPACAVAVAGAYFVKRGYVLDDHGPATRRVYAMIRHLPWLPMTASMLSMAIYGLTVPGCALQVTLSGPAFAITAGCLAVAGGFVMSILAPWLGKGNAAQARPPVT